MLYRHRAYKEMRQSIRVFQMQLSGIVGVSQQEDNNNLQPTIDVCDFYSNWFAFIYELYALGAP